jgi:hypothetical protein
MQNESTSVAAQLPVEETYNGWKNYPTWAVNLWLSNDEPLYLAALEKTREAITRADDNATEHPYWTKEEGHRYSVADMLKEWVTDELAPDLGASFAADLLGYALDCVEWNDIADAWIESVTEQAS